MTAAMAEHIQGSDLLEVVAVAQRIVREGEVDLLVAVVDFCASHPPLDPADRCRVRVPAGGVEGRESLEPLNGEGAPEVSALAVAQLGATLGLSPGSVQRLVAQALELAYRLPDLYAQVRQGRVPVWQARRVARATCGLSREAARFVDRHLQGLTGRIGVGPLDRLIVEAVARHDQARRRELDRARTDHRGFAVELDRCDLLGQVPVHGVLDLPDALALEAAVGQQAEQLSAWGSADSRQARRARAVGDLAREHMAAAGQPVPTHAIWDETSMTLSPVPVPVPRVEGDRSTIGAAAAGSGRTRARREVVLHLHVTDREVLQAVRGRPALGRAEHASTGDLPITAETIRRWCGETSTRVRVLPVLDQQERIHHQAYEIPERLREQIIGRDHTCVFPGCTAPARACDIDHIVPFDHAQPARGGPTATENLACLCRRHHRLKTTGRVSYRMTSPGAFAWDLGTSATFVRDHRGSRRAAEGSQAPRLAVGLDLDERETRATASGPVDPPET